MDSRNSIDEPFTQWIPVTRSGNGQQTVALPVENENPSGKSFSSLASGPIETEIQEPSVRSKRKRKTGNVEAQSADAKFRTLVAGSTKIPKKEDEPEEKEHDSMPENLTYKNMTRKCIELAESALGLKLKRYGEVVSPGKVRFSVELGFGEDKLIYLTFESNGSRNVSDADLVDFFVDDEEYIAEIAPALRKLLKQHMDQSLLLGVAEYPDLKERRREMLERLRTKYNPLMAVDTVKEGHCVVEARDNRRSYFKARWKMVFRKRLCRFDNAFEFYGVQENSPLVVSFDEFSRLTESERLNPKEIENSWDKIMTEVKELYEKQT